MNVLRHLRWSFLAVCALLFVVALSSCSKKDVKSDEPLINPSGESGGAALGGSGGVDSGAGTAAREGELQTVYFDYDRYILREDAKTALRADASWLKKNPSATVQIEGHCDERGTTEYNLALGERRANSTREYLIKLGVPKSRISVISYGEERPADLGHDEAAWARNRRAAFVILSR